MPVAEQVRVSTHTGNGSTTNFAYGYRIFEDADLTVTVDGVVQTLTTDYTVNGAGADSGGTIDFITAPINLSVVTISGELTYERDTDFIQNGGMLANNFDNDFDYAIMLIQQNRRDITRSIKVPIEETTDQEVSTTAANRADKILAFDAAGLPVASSLTDLSSILTTVDTSLVLSGGILSVAIPNRQAVAGGTVDAITATFVPVIAVLANNIEVIVEAAGANTITTPTFAPDGLPAKTMVKGSNTALIVGDIPGADFKMHLVFDATLDKWVFLNPINPSTLSAGSVAAPAVGWTDTGFYEPSANQIGVTLGGADKWLFNGNSLQANNAAGPALRGVSATATDPTIVPNQADTNTGIGRAGADQLSLISGGIESARASIGTSNVFTVKAGNSTDYGNVAGKVSINTTAVGTDADTNEKDLMAYSLPANSLSADGKGVRVKAWGIFEANANTKTIRSYFGSVLTQFTGTESGNTWEMNWLVFRTGSSTQKTKSNVIIEAANGFPKGDISTLTETDSSAIVIRVTGQNGSASANDIICEGMLVEFLN